MREFQDDPRSDEEVCACFLCHLISVQYLHVFSVCWHLFTSPLIPAPLPWNFLFFQVLGSIKEIYFSDTSFDSSDHELHVSELAVEAFINSFYRNPRLSSGICTQRLFMHCFHWNL